MIAEEWGHLSLLRFRHNVVDLASIMNHGQALDGGPLPRMYPRVIDRTDIQDACLQNPPPITRQRWVLPLGPRSQPSLSSN